jgi:hypothetical protein
VVAIFGPERRCHSEIRPRAGTHPVASTKGLFEPVKGRRPEHDRGDTFAVALGTLLLEKPTERLGAREHVEQLLALPVDTTSVSLSVMRLGQVI